MTYVAAVTPGQAPRSTRSNDADGGEVALLPSGASPLRMSPSSTVGNWSCECGQEYRVRIEPLTFWARNSQRGFRADPTTACLACGADLEECIALDTARLVSAAMIG